MAELSPTAQAVYDEARSTLSHAPTAPERELLRSYAVAVVEMRDAQEQIERLGAVVRTPSGVVVSPYVGVRDRARQVVERLSARLGLGAGAGEGQEPKRAIGRPSAYDPSYCELVLQKGAEGMGRAEIAFEIGVCRNTLTNWEEAHPEFLSAMTRARDASLAWWEREGRNGLNKGSAFNANLYGKCMGGRFPEEPYRERVQLTGKDDGPIVTASKEEVDLSKLSLEELRELERIASKLAGEPSSGDPAAAGGGGEGGPEGEG